MQDEIIPAEMEAFIDHLDAQECRERDEFLVDEMENLAYGEAVMNSMFVW
jgi:hypothetical protein